ncbi:hypothetical protein FGE12_15880 [Aggregicoccus sp. 17bor-14]|uniref:lamin tail domain-containing protein n=1 Tax=Myxococcaceae TaxID=31 RepID=UPI00129D00D6|nr:MULTISPECIES: lamin tail domain-containing protein [Myxococcaceae]MBF5043879.1 lamin tail domain-containing protein [Simulacricoccus sp. 17bor-14]MRI89631.1 hypothetical protein [Aggregicoccus sp. 17bor-14]
MKPTSPSAARIAALLLLGVLVMAGCDGATPPPKVDPGASAPDAARSSVEVSPTAHALANGVDAVEVKVTVRTAAGAALPGLTVTLSAEGEGRSVQQPAAPTDAQGVATARVTSTVAGTGAVTARVAAQGSSVELASHPTVTFAALPASRLAFAAPPPDAVAGAPLAEVAVRLQDADGRTVTDATGSVTLALGSGPADAALQGTLTAEAVEGVAHFPGLTLERAGEGYSLLASAAGLTGATSAPFAVTPAPVAQLALRVSPATVEAGTPADLEVTALDTFGNTVTGFRGTVAFNPGALAEGLPADYTFTAADLGHHTFPGGAALTRAAVHPLTVVDVAASPLVAGTAQLTVLPAEAQRLSTAVLPTGLRVRQPFTLDVSVQDAYGNLVPSSSAAVSLALGPSGTLSGTSTLSAESGVAHFFGLSIAQERADWVLVASAAGLESSATPAFSVTDDVAPALPVLALAGQATATSLTVAWTAVGDDGSEGTAAQHELRYSLQDIASDADFAGATPVALGAPRASGGAESASLSGLAPHTTYYVALQVTDDAGNRVRSATLPVSTAFATAAKLAFLDQPSAGTAGAALPGLRVAVQDAEGLGVDQADSAVTLSVEGVSGFGPWTVSASGGIATFSNVRIDRAGADYRLVASSGGLTGAASQPFAIGHAAAARLALSGLPSGVVVGDAQSVGVTVKDAFDNTVVDATNALTLSSTDGAATLPAAHTLTAAEGGEHTFTGIVFETGGSQRLTVSAAGLTSAAQTTEVDDPTPRGLVLSGLASQGTAGDSVTVTLEARDAMGRVAPGYRGTVHFTTDDAQATLPADYTFTEADAGQHAFSLALRSAGTHSVTATDTASAGFSASAGTTVRWAPLASLTLQGPAKATAGSPVTVSLLARDAFGNAVRDYAGTVHFSSADAQAVLPADYTFTSLDEGNRRFPVTLVRAGSTVLSVADAAAGLGDAATLAVDAGAASGLELAAAAGPVTAGTPLSLTLSARDAWGNLVPGYTGTVHFTSDDTQAVLPGDSAFSAADAGQHAFSAELRTAGTRQLAAVDLAQVTLRAQLQREVVPAAPSTLRFADAPASGTVRTALSTVQVEVLDAYANRVTESASAITLSLAGGNAAATLSGTRAVAPSSGVASYPDLSVDQQGTGFVLVASVTGLAGATSAPFSIVDDQAPATPSLSASEVYSDRLTLSWLAVGDDGSAGQASAQELRYATSALTAETFGSGQQVALGAPAASGTSESVTMAGLAAGTAYHFALRVSDDAGNVSYAFLDASTAADPCAGVTCTPSADSCAADGVTRLTYSASCAVVNDAPSCQEQSTSVACTGANAVCVQGACTAAPPPAASELVISEVMHTPSVGTTEYVELTNTTQHLLNLNGVTLSYAGTGTPGSFTVGTGVPVVLGAGGRFVLAQSAGADTNGGVAANAAYGEAFLLDGQGTLDVKRGSTSLDSLAYTPSFPQTPGRAMSLAASIVGTSASAHPWYWCDATDVLAGGDRGTPGAANGSCGIAVQAPVDFCAIQSPKTIASVAPGASTSVYGQFYEPGATDRNLSGNDGYPHVFAELGYGTSTDVSTWTWGAAPFDAGFVTTGNNDQVVGTLSIPNSGSYLYGFRYQVRDPATGALSPYTYCDQDGVATPSAGNYGTVTVAALQPPLTNHVVISEFSGGNGTGTAATDEFIELYNPTNADVDLSNWQVGYKSATGTTWSSTVTIPAGKIIRAHGYFLLAGANYSGGATAPRDVPYTFDASSSTTAGGHVRLQRLVSGTYVDVDKLGWGTGNSPEGTAAPAHPAVGGSLERKAVSTSTSATMAVGGADALRGNSQDTDDNSKDFVTRAVRQPQSSVSPTEIY